MHSGKNLFITILKMTAVEEREVRAGSENNNPMAILSMHTGLYTDTPLSVANYSQPTGMRVHLHTNHQSLATGIGQLHRAKRHDGEELLGLGRSNDMIGVTHATNTHTLQDTSRPLPRNRRGAHNYSSDSLDNLGVTRMKVTYTCIP